ncbi:hypothetical protein [Rhizobium leguminosarum]|nr:hypothetical protein U8Q02_42185 [Rhizobium leguminosarum]
MAIWFHGCDMGRGVVSAPNEEKARREAVLDAGKERLRKEPK